MANTLRSIDCSDRRYLAARIAKCKPPPAKFFLQSGWPAHALTRLVKANGLVGDGDGEHRASAGALDELQLPTMGAHQFIGDGEAKPGAAAAGRTAEGGKQVLARL